MERVAADAVRTHAGAPVAYGSWDPQMRVALSIVVVLAAASAGRAQIVQGQVEAVGFQAASGPVFREGQWLPVLVTVRTQGSQIFNGQLRVECVDLDGDRVAYANAQVTVTADIAGGKRFWCYAVINTAREVPTQVDVIGEEGGIVTTLLLPPQPPGPIWDDDLLVLDVSYPDVNVLRGALETPLWAPGQATRGMRQHYRNVVVARMPADQLPDRWWGLEAVDVVVWDQPAPEQLSIAQRDALVNWVRNGGQLIVGVGASWNRLLKSDLGPLLPLAGAGDTLTVQRLPVFVNRFAARAGQGADLRDPLVVTTAGLAPDAVRILGEHGPTGPLNMIATRWVDSGRVTTTAAGLRDLTGLGINNEAFLNWLLDQSTYTAKFNENQAEAASYGGILPDYLYDQMVAPIAFGGETAIRGLTAFLFVAAYVGVATLLSWWWLRMHNLTQLSWVVFGGFAVAASFLSLSTVSALRGCSRGVQSVCVLDLADGESLARGPCLFGYRSPVRQRVELQMPEGEHDAAYLRPLAQHPNPLRHKYYVTATRYEARPANSQLSDVLMRATLKQFEGYWEGELDGSIRGDLVADRRTGQLTPGSWLANDLNVELAGAYLLYIDPRLDVGGMGVPARIAGVDGPYELAPGLLVTGSIESNLDKVPPALNVLALQLGKLGPGERVREIGTKLYEEVDQRWVRWANGPGRKKRSDMPDLPTLWHAQSEWQGGILAQLRQTLIGPVRAAMLASTRNLHLHNRGSNFDAVGTPISTAGLPELDVTHWLRGGVSEGQAVLLAWAHEPGPATLLRNGRPMPAHRGLTIYRVRIPIRYEGSPPRQAAPPTADAGRGSPS